SVRHIFKPISYLEIQLLSGVSGGYIKLEKARSLLVSTSLSINEISQMCGYPSLQYFYSVFKKEYDVTPKEYRDRHSEVML
ncbi:helix-turn-helix transcriptional regulator, partial [Klebsiella pneumoniae]